MKYPASKLLIVASFGCCVGLATSTNAHAAGVDAYQPFATHLQAAQTRNHLHGEYFSGSEDNVDLSGLRLSGAFQVADFAVAQTPVALSLLGQYQAAEIDLDGPPGFPADNDIDFDTLNIGAKGAWAVPAVRNLLLSTGAYLSFVDVDGPGGGDTDESGLVGFGSARYTVNPRFATYGTLLVSSEDAVQDTGIVAGLLYDLGTVALGAEVATPDDTTVTPYVTWAPGPAVRLNFGIQTGADPDPILRGQVSWLFGR